jgi:ATP-dependent Lon protease
MCTALVSALTNVPVRSSVAMTGEITLRGEVLPIGGLKEKLLAAHRGGIETVLIPHENERDLVEIPKNIKQSLDIRAVRWIDEVLDLALTEIPKPGSEAAAAESPAAEEKETPPAKSPKAEKDPSGVRTHH